MLTHRTGPGHHIIGPGEWDDMIDNVLLVSLKKICKCISNYLTPRFESAQKVHVICFMIHVPTNNL